MQKKLKISIKGIEPKDICVDGIKLDNTYKYLEDDLMVLITYYKDNIIIKRSNSEYRITLNLKKNKHTISTYEFIGGNKVFELNTITNKLLISDNKIIVKYNLEGNDFEFILEVVE